MAEVSLKPQLRFPEFEGEWEYTQIEKYFEFKNGLNKEKEYFGRGTPIINFMDVYKLNSIQKKDILGLVELSESEIQRYSALKGDVFFTRTSETIHDIGMSATLIEKIPNCVFSGFVLRARPLSNKFAPLFTSFLFNVESVRKEIVTKSSMTTRALTSGTSLNKVYFKFPKELKEQQKIASFLTAVDTRISLLSHKKEKLELYKKGVMQKIFNQEIRFKDAHGNSFPDWEEKKLGEIIKVQGGFAFKSSKFLTSGVPVIRISNISNEHNYIDDRNLVYYKEQQNDKNYTIHKGNLLIAMSGATTGKTSIYNKEKKAYLNQRVGLFKGIYSNLHYPFITQYVFSSSFKTNLKSLLVAGAQPNISSHDIESIIIQLPTLPEQQKIASFLSALDVKIEAVEKQIEGMKQWKQGLMQKMFI